MKVKEKHLKFTTRKTENNREKQKTKKIKAYLSDFKYYRLQYYVRYDTPVTKSYLNSINLIYTYI